MSAVVSLSGVAAAYPGRTLWRDLSLDIQPGEFVAVLGGNGTGKTTLLKLLLGTLRPAAGEVRILGDAVRRGDRRVGYMPQHRNFDRDLPARGIDLVALGAVGHRFGLRRTTAGTRDRIRHAIAAVGAAGYASAPVGLLSGGEQQRLRVAAAIVDDPALILADEPLASLDVGSQRQVADVLDSCRTSTGAAVVVVTHDVNPLLRHVDRVLYLAAGRWAAGTTDEVLTSARLSALYGLQVDVVRVRDHVVIVGAPDDPHGHHHHHGGEA
ncbi:MAG: metal ABC transporter ATP-binding protein [Frankiaceae bacterium]|nr:metal ABC transporter ATP-binding protein [Frankiaceae bacterium]MBV9871561.1 metal ABC transporter ATP-binding protein [Frankiaceae bacterium]